MKMKKIVDIIIFATIPFLLQAQTVAVQHKLFATTEKEMYRIYEQMLDSAIALKNPLIGSYFLPIENKDTLMKFEQYCRGFPGRKAFILMGGALSRQQRERR